MYRIAVMLTLALASAASAVAGGVAFLDAERAVQQVAEGKAKLAELEKWAKPRRDEVARLQQEAASLNQELQQKRAVATPDALSELQQRARDAARKFEDARRQFQRDLDTKQNEFLSDVAVKVGTVASDYGRQQGYDAIFVLNAQPLVYVADGADVTDTVIRLYDQRFPHTGK